MSYITLKNKIEKLIEKIQNNEAPDELYNPYTLSGNDGPQLTRIIAIDFSKGNFLPTGTSYVNLFNGMSNLKTVTNFHILPTITNISSLFWQCYLTEDPLDWEQMGQEVSHIVSVGNAFGRAFGKNYINVSLPNFNWENATQMNGILYDNQETILDLSGWKFPKMIYPPDIYWNRSLTTLNIDGWDFSNFTRFASNGALSTAYWLAQDWQLSTIQGNFTGLGNKMDTVSFTSAYMDYTSDKPHVGFDTDTVTRLINALVEKTDGGTYSLVLSLNTEPNVTEEQIAAAAEKGWDISFE